MEDEDALVTIYEIVGVLIGRVLDQNERSEIFNRFKLAKENETEAYNLLVTGNDRMLSICYKLAFQFSSKIMDKKDFLKDNYPDIKARILRRKEFSKELEKNPYLRNGRNYKPNRAGNNTKMGKGFTYWHDS